MHNIRSQAGGAPGNEPTTPPRQGLSLEGALREMEVQLHHHSALEDLGPLFGPEAQGRRPNHQSSGEPASGSGQA